MAEPYLETFYNTDETKRFAFPGKLIWGSGSRRLVSELIPRSGSVDVYVDRYFADHHLSRETLEPIHDSIRKIVAVAAEPKYQAVVGEAGATGSSPDAVIAMGGGSTLDFAKAVTAMRLFGSVDGIGMGDKRGRRPQPDARRPRIVALPTTAGTGAEASRYYVTYDAVTKHKVHGKSWELVADWIVLDPAFVRSCPDSLLVATAFDAFVHLFESLVCRHERSWFGQMLSYDAIPRLLRALDAVVHEGQRDDENYLELLYSASVGGIAISNVRTGNVHEAAGALLELTDLSHPETLFVFWQSAYEQYADAVADVTTQLFGRLAMVAPHLQISTPERLTAWWSVLFDEMGITTRIRERVTALVSDAGEVRSRVFERVWSDRVWIEKESPVHLDASAVGAFVDEALSRAGLLLRD